jgi:hypothetical protein
MHKLRTLTACLTALGLLAFGTGCMGGSDPSRPPGAPPAEEPATPPADPPATQTTFLEFTRELIVNQTSDTGAPVAVPGPEVVDSPEPTPFYEESFFR